jgi:hypothetical protein
MKKAVFSRVALTIVLALAVSIVMPVPLMAQGSPPGANYNGVDQSLAVIPTSGANGMTFEYYIIVENDPAPPSPPGLISADAANITVTFFPPGADGNPVSTGVVIDTIPYLAVGDVLSYNSTNSSALSVVLNVNPGVTVARASSNIYGDLLTEEGDTVDDTKDMSVTVRWPDIDIEKYVSVNGVDWFDADDPTGPTTTPGADIWFKVEVCNNGTTPLNSIVINDTDFTFTGVTASLAVGECDESDVLVTTAVVGQHYNLATVKADAEGIPVSDEDPAHYITWSEVGGTALPVDKFRLVAPWAVLLGCAAVVALIVLRKRREA